MHADLNYKLLSLTRIKIIYTFKVEMYTLRNASRTISTQSSG